MSRKIPSIGWVFWALAAAFYFYELILRIAPSVMVSDLMHAFNIDAAVVGTIVASYLYIYAPMQLVVGILLDRYTVRILLTISVLTCGIGSLFWGFAPNSEIAIIGRVLMGFGSSFSFLTMVYISSHWFPEKLFPILMGLGNSFGMIGAVWAQGPLSHFVDKYGWRVTSITLGGIGVVYGVLIFVICFVVYSGYKEIKCEAKEKTELLKSLRVIVSKAQSWIIAGVSFLMFATTSAFAGLWGVTFIKEAHGYTEQESGFAISMIFIGWIFGGPTLGYLKSRFLQIKTILILSSLLAFVSLTLTIYITSLPTFLTFSLLFTVGFFSSSMLLMFDYTTLINSPLIKGTALGVTSLAAMLGGSVLEPVVGYLLDLHAGIGVRNTSHDLPFSVSDYQFALSSFPICFALAFILALFLKRDDQLSAT